MTAPVYSIVFSSSLLTSLLIYISICFFSPQLSDFVTACSHQSCAPSRIPFLPSLSDAFRFRSALPFVHRHVLCSTLARFVRTLAQVYTFVSVFSVLRSRSFQVTDLYISLARCLSVNIISSPRVLVLHLRLCALEHFFFDSSTLTLSRRTDSVARAATSVFAFFSHAHIHARCLPKQRTSKEEWTRRQGRELAACRRITHTINLRVSATGRLGDRG